MKARVHHSHTAGLRAVATLEILKGVAAVLAGIGLLMLMHRSDLGDFAEDIIFRLHLNPTSRIPWLLIEKAYDVKNKSLWTVVGVAFGYASVRFIEGYGLWHERVWAEWFALLSGTAYIPFEIFEIIRHANLLKWIILVINIGIVIYMAYVRFYDPAPVESSERTTSDVT
jgi:uncharacterized membrane protein (DUF2068 family)